MNGTERNPLLVTAHHRAKGDLHPFFPDRIKQETDYAKEIIEKGGSFCIKENREEK